MTRNLKRVKCDASRSGLGLAHEQLTNDGCKPIEFTSQFLNSREERLSVKELKVLGVVWSIEYFKNISTANILQLL